MKVEIIKNGNAFEVWISQAAKYDNWCLEHRKPRAYKTDPRGRGYGNTVLDHYKCGCPLFTHRRGIKRHKVGDLLTMSLEEFHELRRGGNSVFGLGS